MTTAIASAFFATGISLAAHMANPHVPAVHMNCRFLNTTKRWFGGGGDLNPPLPIAEDTADFHAAFKAAQDGRVAVIGSTRPETVAALLEWSVEGRAASVALAPASAVMMRE